jgi:hypothetical protein
MFVDIFDGVGNGTDLLGGVVGYFYAEFFLEGHDQFNDVEAVRTKIVNEAGIFSDLFGLNAQMLNDDFFDPIGSVAHQIAPYEWEDGSLACRPNAQERCWQVGDACAAGKAGQCALVLGVSVDPMTQQRPVNIRG